jgi:hypothetical protein
MALHKSTFNEVLQVIDNMPLEKQSLIIEILENRYREKRREEILRNSKPTLQLATYSKEKRFFTPFRMTIYVTLNGSEGSSYELVILILFVTLCLRVFVFYQSDTQYEYFVGFRSSIQPTITTNYNQLTIGE